MDSLSNLSSLSSLSDLSDQSGRELRTWLREPEKAFSEWAVNLDLKESSEKVKGSMWGKFSRWMSVKGIGLDRCHKTHIDAFFKEEKIRKEHRYRYIRLIEQVYAHLIFLGLSMKNPGQEASYARLGDGANDPMHFFNEEERQKIDHGIRVRLGACRDRQERIESKERIDSNLWTLQRDAALCGVLWGGGLRVSEACELSVNCTYEDGVIVIPANGPIAEHRAQLLPIGKLAMDTWLPLRERVHVQSNALFPPDTLRRRSDVLKVKEYIHPSNLYRRINALLIEFGITGKRISPQTLRNTYAAMCIEAGWNDSIILASMGLVEDTTLIRIRAKHKVWKNGGVSDLPNEANAR